jgi:hypothetical protein
LAIKARREKQAVKMGRSCELYVKELSIDVIRNSDLRPKIPGNLHQTPYF